MSHGVAGRGTGRILAGAERGKSGGLGFGVFNLPFAYGLEQVRVIEERLVSELRRCDLSGRREALAVCHCARSDVPPLKLRAPSVPWLRRHANALKEQKERRERESARGAVKRGTTVDEGALSLRLPRGHLFGVRGESARAS